MYLTENSNLQFANLQHSSLIYLKHSGDGGAPEGRDGVDGAVVGYLVSAALFHVGAAVVDEVFHDLRENKREGKDNCGRLTMHSMHSC